MREKEIQQTYRYGVVNREYITEVTTQHCIVCLYGILKYRASAPSVDGRYMTNAVTVRPVTGTVACALYIRLPEI